MVEEVTYKSWFERLTDSIKSVVFGLVLLVVGVGVLFWNEGRAVKMAQDLAAADQALVKVDSKTIDPANNDKFIFFNGTAITDEQIADKDFGVMPKDKVLRLKRTVSMYQWEQKEEKKTEKQLGGGEKTVTKYTYNKAWSDKAIDSSAFKEAGHSNPSMPFGSSVLDATPIKVGAFTLSTELVGKLTDWQKYPIAAPATGPATAPAVEATATPAAAPAGPAAAGLKVAEGMFYKGADPATPQIGDAKIGFAVIPSQPVTIRAKQYDGKLVAFVGPNGNSIIELSPGTLTREQMSQKAQAANNMLAWILRLVGFVALWIGLASILSPLVVVADIIPFIGDLLQGGVAILTGLMALVISLVVIGIGWLVYRPQWGICLLALAAAALVGTKYIKKGKQPAAPVAAR